MKPLRRLGEAAAPDGTVLTLFEHDGAYTIRVNGVDLMSTRKHQSEEVFAGLLCAPLAGRPGARVLIGGLGLGFTLKAALRLLSPDAQVVVVEIVGEVIAWNRDPNYPLAGDALRDPRVELLHADVAEVLAQRAAAFDAILLDVDNGTEPLTTSGNAALYRADGIRRARSALRPGGRIGYWSANDDPAFERALRREGLAVQVTRVRAHGERGARHSVIVAG